MEQNFKELYKKRQEKEERRRNNKPAIIALIAAVFVIGFGLLGAWYDVSHDTTVGIEMFAVFVVLFVITITRIRL